MSLKEFLKSKVFLRQLGLAMVIGVGLIIILIIWLNIYTRHGQSRPVPEVRGLTLEEARRTVLKNRMRFTVIDSVYTSFVPRGCIAEQMPLPGHRVKKGRMIKVTINAFNPEMVAVPDLVGLPRRQALSLIETAGLVPGQLNYVPDLTVDFVLKQTIHGREMTPGRLSTERNGHRPGAGQRSQQPAYCDTASLGNVTRRSTKPGIGFFAEPRSIRLRCHRD